MRTLPTLLTVVACGGLSAFAADEKAAPSPWVIRDAIANPSDLADTKPATVVLTDNHGAPDSFLVDLAVNYFHPVDWLGGARENLIVTGEWHRNSTAKAPSHSLLASFSLAGTLGNVGAAGGGAALNYVLTTTGKDDRIKDDQSLAVGTEVCLLTSRGSPLAFLSSGFQIPFPNGSKPSVLIEPLLMVGAQYEDLMSSSAPVDSGHVLRGSLRYSLKATFPAAAPNLVFSAEARYWHDLDEGGAYRHSVDTRRLYQYGLTYYFDADKTWGVALKHRDGEDPAAGKPKQRFTSLALTCNFGKR